MARPNERSVASKSSSKTRRSKPDRLNWPRKGRGKPNEKLVGILKVLFLFVFNALHLIIYLDFYDIEKLKITSNLLIPYLGHCHEHCNRKI